ncbi:hypothetical protein B0H14DRAFT_2796922 [Mycena olivaceomarginata]|nr:hypothetical protein B0H14DRAFT_2796922 [Mycena olivaceomarginata]
MPTVRTWLRLLSGFAVLWSSVTMGMAIALPSIQDSRPFEAALRIYAICCFVSILLAAFGIQAAHQAPEGRESSAHQSLQDRVRLLSCSLGAHTFILLGSTAFMLVTVFKPGRVAPRMEVPMVLLSLFLLALHPVNMAVSYQYFTSLRGMKAQADQEVEHKKS